MDKVGAPIGLDFGFGSEGFQKLRVIWGLRVSLAPAVELHLQPLTPQLTIIDDQPIWDAPSTLQLALTF